VKVNSLLTCFRGSLLIVRIVGMAGKVRDLGEGTDVTSDAHKESTRMAHSRVARGLNSHRECQLEWFQIMMLFWSIDRKADMTNSRKLCCT
jgi:hypothetical protein